MPTAELEAPKRREVHASDTLVVDRLSARKKFQVASTPIGDTLGPKNRPIVARLCGGVTTCIATIEA